MSENKASRVDSPSFDNNAPDSRARRSIVTSLFAAATVAACGGGSSGTTPAPSPQPPPAPPPPPPAPPPPPPPAPAGAIDFGPAVVVASGQFSSFADGFTADPRIVLSPSGVADVIWAQFGLKEDALSAPNAQSNVGAARSVSGTSWSSPVLIGNILGDSGSVNIEDVSVTALPNGFSAIWKRTSPAGARLVNVQRTDAAAVTHVVAAQAQQSLFKPQIASNARGDQAAAWLDSSAVNPRAFLAVYAAGDAAWSTPIALQTSPSTGAEGIAVAIDPSGLVMVVWAESNPSSLKSRSYQFGAASPLGPESSVGSALPGSAIAPRVAAAGSGHFVAVWNQLALGTNQLNDDIRGAQYLAGAWQATADLLESRPDSVYDLRIASASSGTAAALWNRGDLGIRCSRHEGDAWGAPTTIAGRQVNASISSLEATISPAGDVIVAWLRSSAAGYDVLYAVQSVSGAVAPAALLEVDTDSASFPTVAASDNGAVAVAWLQRTGTSQVALFARLARN